MPCRQTALSARGILCVRPVSGGGASVGKPLTSARPHVSRLLWAGACHDAFGLRHSAKAVLGQRAATMGGYVGRRAGESSSGVGRRRRLGCKFRVEGVAPNAAKNGEGTHGGLFRLLPVRVGRACARNPWRQKSLQMSGSGLGETGASAFQPRPSQCTLEPADTVRGSHSGGSDSRGAVIYVIG